jgi:hypothetical protein
VAEERAASGLALLLPVLETNQTYFWATSVCITHVLKMATNSSTVSVTIHTLTTYTHACTFPFFPPPPLQTNTHVRMHAGAAVFRGGF